ncbi:hypothetical protein, partial [Paraburkholderia sp. UYCP14C]|uniref:hypothetical protein n=1 Tax=Paraburkholderia sp. UYCP14C TaxID=2511130 RepID=UPI001B7D651E
LDAGIISDPQHNHQALSAEDPAEQSPASLDARCVDMLGNVAWRTASERRSAGLLVPRPV